MELNAPRRSATIGMLLHTPTCNLQCLWLLWKWAASTAGRTPNGFQGGQGVSGLKQLGCRELNYRLGFLACATQVLFQFSWLNL